MNRIYKKIFNKARGCFVAVSEVITSASQNGGKAGSALIAGALLMAMQAPVQALVTINGDVVGTSGLVLHHKGNVLLDNHVINGNFTWNLGPTNHNEDAFQDTHLAIGMASKTFGVHSCSLTVNGNFNITNSSVVHVGHNSNKDGDVTSTLKVVGDLNIENGSGLHLISTGSSGNYPVLHSNLTVDGTVYNKGFIVSWSGSETEKSYGSFTINKLVNTGTFGVDAYNPLNGTFNDISVNGGNFYQYAKTHYVVNNSLTLNTGGTITNVSPLTVGQNSGDFIVSKTLNLNGGGLTNTSSLTQGSGTINVTRGNYGFGTLTKSNGSLNNSATLAFTNFNQSNGTTTNTGNLTIGNSNLNGTLTSSGTLTLTGNVTTRGNLSSTGTLNNKGTWTENNAYAIAGTLNNSGTTTFQKGFTFADNGRLNSTGTVQTSDSSNIFESLGTTGAQDLHFVSLNSKTEQEVKTSLNDFFQKYVKGSVAKNLIDHASFSGGKVIISGVNITKTQALDLEKEFKSKIYSLFPA